jgi:threonine dehydrogenase-like Zn-dependent dehydrogenase
MYIVIVGAGNIGSPLIEIATVGGNEVVVIERDEEKVERAADTYDCLVIDDGATVKETLLDAGIRPCRRAHLDDRPGRDQHHGLPARTGVRRAGDRFGSPQPRAYAASPTDTVGTGQAVHAAPGRRPSGTPGGGCRR